MAVGAWSARLEIAGMIESGIPAKDILAAIRSGEEGETPLENKPGESSRDPQSRRSGKKRSLEKALGLEESPPRAKSSTYSKEMSFPDPSSPAGGGRDPSAPAWAGASLANLEFAKKAAPPDVRGRSYSPSSSEEDERQDSEGRTTEDEVETINPKEEVDIFRDYKKRAVPPPRTPFRLEKEVPKVQKTLPNRANPLEAEKLADFRTKCRTIFEELVILKVKMDLVASVVPSAGSDIDEEMFHTLTDPRSAGTGLRYARLMKSHLEAYEALEKKDRPDDVFGLAFVQERVLDLIKSNAGYRTPQGLLYAIDHFSVIFGFVAHGAKHPRCRKLANDYSKQAPERVGAPHFGVGFLDYLEKVTLDESKELETRVACGKLLVHPSLCQAQWPGRHGHGCGGMVPCGRYHGVPWFESQGSEDKDGTQTLGCLLVRGGTGEWWMDGRPDEVGADHARSDLETARLLGCSGDGKGHFRHVPPTIEEDVILVKRSLSMDKDAGRSVPLSQEEIASLRWHSCKSTMPSLMAHYGIQARTIRLQGAWRKQSEAMTDLYLREAQTIVLKAQIQVLDQVRRGVAIQVLEGRSLDELPTTPNWETATCFAKRGLGAPEPDDAMGALNRAVACYKDESGHMKIRNRVAAAAKDLAEEFLGDTPTSQEAVIELAESECEMVGDMDAVNREMVKETAVPDDPDTDSDDPDANPVKSDMELYQAFVTKTRGHGKVHKPGLDAYPGPAKPRCGTAGDEWTELGLGENWGSYSLWSRCFGKVAGCRKLCSYEVKRRGVSYRCGRRCLPESNLDHKENAEDGLEGPHFCALHAAEVEMRDEAWDGVQYRIENSDKFQGKKRQKLSPRFLAKKRGLSKTGFWRVFLAAARFKGWKSCTRQRSSLVPLSGRVDEVN